jgi:hypothetical protein
VIKDSNVIDLESGPLGNIRIGKVRGNNFENLEADAEEGWADQGMFDEWSNNIVAFSTPLK